ncbi:MAG: hypothetical protein V2A69_15040 [Pseudomonadota bacterium]
MSAEKLKKIGGEHIKGEKRALTIAKRLLKVTEELSAIARLCIEEIEVSEVTLVEELKKEEVVISEKAEPAIKPIAVAKEELETEEELYFANQLKGYSGVLAAFEALDRDICHNGCSLPAAVVTAQKRLKRLKESISNSSISDRKRQELENRVNDFMEMLESLPQDKSQPCQKTAGNCTIGAGCFASGALKLVDLITEPVPPKNL